MHAPKRPTETSEDGPSVVVREAGSQQYQEKWSDATVVTKRRPSMASISGTTSPKRTNWISIGIWIAVGAAAFGLGGVLTHLRSSGDGSGTVVQASGPAGTTAPQAEPHAATPEPAQEPSVAPQEVVDAAPPEAAQEAEAETLDPSELKQVPKQVVPRATAKPKQAAPPPTAAPKVSAPAKGGIPSEI